MNGTNHQKKEKEGKKKDKQQIEKEKKANKSKQVEEEGETEAGDDADQTDIEAAQARLEEEVNGVEQNEPTNKSLKKDKKTKKAKTSGAFLFGMGTAGFTTPPLFNKMTK